MTDQVIADAVISPSATWQYVSTTSNGAQVFFYRDTIILVTPMGAPFLIDCAPSDAMPTLSAIEHSVGPNFGTGDVERWFRLARRF